MTNARKLTHPASWILFRRAHVLIVLCSIYIFIRLIGMKECCWQKCWFRLSFKLRGHGRPGERINEFSDSPAINENSASCQNGKGELEAETRSAERPPQKYRIHGERASRMVSCCFEINNQSDTFLAKRNESINHSMSEINPRSPC